MQIDVRTDVSAVLAQFERIKRDVVEKATVRALNRVADMAKTQTSRELKSEGYNFTPSEIKDAISISRASAGRLITTMRVRRKTKSLMEFKPVETKAGVRVKVHGSAKVIKGAFIGQLRNGRVGVYVEDKAAGKVVLRHARQYVKGSRGGWHDYPVRKLYGPSVGGAYVNERVQAAMRAMISEKFVERLTHEIKQLTR